MHDFFRDFKSDDSWEYPQLMGILAVVTANHWLKNELNSELINLEEADKRLLFPILSRF